MSCLKSGRETDRQLGYTKHGAHRAEVQLLLNDYPLSSSYSGGQIKLFITLLLVAQGMVFETATGERPLYLIDDLDAELDHYTYEKLVSLFVEQEAQIFLTSTDMEQKFLIDKSFKLFHVKHGALEKVIK